MGQFEINIESYNKNIINKAIMIKSDLLSWKILLISTILATLISAIPFVGLLFSFEAYTILYVVFHFPSFIVTDQLAWYITDESLMETSVIVGMVLDTVLYTLFIYLVLITTLFIKRDFKVSH